MAEPDPVVSTRPTPLFILPTMTQRLPSSPTDPQETVASPPAATSSGKTRIDRQAQLEEMKRGRELWTLETWRAYLQANPVPEDEPGGDLWEAIQKMRAWASEEEK